MALVGPMLAQQKIVAGVCCVLIFINDTMAKRSAAFWLGFCAIIH